MTMSLLFSLIFIYEYIQNKNKSILLGIPLVIYCFILLPFLYEKFDKALIFLMTLLVCIPICICIYHGTKPIKKSSK